MAVASTKPNRKSSRPEDGPPPWIDAFLNALLLGSTVSDAARCAQVSGSAVYDRRKTDPEFAERWNDAITIGTELLEGEAQRRAYHGVEEAVYYKGEVCGYVRDYSDTLLLRLLEARKPEMYRKDHTVNVQITNAVTAISVLRDSVGTDQLRATLASMIDVQTGQQRQCVVEQPAPVVVNPPTNSRAPALVPTVVKREDVDVAKLRATVAALGDAPAPMPSAAQDVEPTGEVA